VSLRGGSEATDEAIKKEIASLTAFARNDGQIEMKKLTPVVEKHYQLILWMFPKIANFPKDQRFLLADRIERILLDILEMLIEAVYSKDRRGILIKINLKLDSLRFMMRIAKDMKYINIKAYDFFCQSVLEIGRMVGGWMRTPGS